MDKNLQRRMKRGISLFIAGMLLCLSGYAQNLRISGKITSADDANPMMGVSIHVKGISTGAQSAVDGSYVITAKQGDILVFSYLGYTSQEITVKETNVIDVKLNSTSSNLNEVVVIGYGKPISRKDGTGSISSIKGDNLRQTQPTTFDQALQGKVAGVVVQQISGQPGGGVSIQIRGVSSISGTNSPLYIIDGIIIPPVSDPGNGGNPLNAINPAEIESIDVLKDASATAIYGSQATNGVIVITTKRGKAGAPTVSYDFYTGDQELAKRLPIVNLQQFATLLNARAQVWGFDARPQFADPQYLGTGTDWQSALFRRAPMNNHTLTISGGDLKTQYLLSASYFDQEGIALGSDFKRYSVRLNLDNKTTNWLKVGTSLQLAHTYQNQNTSANAVIGDVLNITPDIAVKNSDGSYGGVTNPNGYTVAVPNPVALAQLVTNVSTGNQIFGNAYAEIQFYRDLSLRTEVSGNFFFNTADNFTPTYQFGLDVNGVNNASSTMGQNFYTVLRNFLTYNHNFSKYSVNVLAGHEAQMSSYENLYGFRSNFPSNNVTALNAGDATTAKNSGDNSGPTGNGGTAQESYFGRVNFSWDDKYLITGNIRDDGSSNFAPGHNWATTYSGAVAWKINNEAFLKGVKGINELKLRLGYGLTNNQGIPGNTFVTQLTSVATGLSGISQFQNNLANPNVTWEKTNYYNAGLDGTFFNGRINFSFDVYDRETHGLLLKEPFPLYSGTTANYSPGAMQAPYVNVGAVSNKGFDFQISTTNISGKSFTWKTDLTLSRNVNKVLSLGSGGADANLSETSNVINDVVEKTVVGQPIGEFYGYVFDGVFANANDFKTHALPVNQAGVPYPISSAGGGIWYGDRMFKDLNGDGIIDSRDETFLGSPLPKFQYGINNSFSYKNFDLNIFFSGDYGNKIFNQVAIAQNNPQNNTAYFTSVLNYAKLALINPAGSASDVNNVYVTNPNTTIVGLRNDNTNDNNRPSNLFIEDGSFLKCKNITLGYRLPENVLSKIYVHSIRVYATVTNVFTITKYTGMDPEIGSWNPLQAGWDSGYYPQPRVFTIGANLTFNK
ncbi:SusC/RagA family TonB-linked outer membrane protein [Mucilaginibacter sp. X5P1]|uniref:SusC/RagA family TonB-linked outer membrane protein n=1 Tax=Mucilaginibacter sp. X5P1 TaxID=2723088 RepID=UPI001615EE69|nr:TonB-dependent receptor [Mucilaginibacter sp. X5P1]MBB6141866.1 TonB-linked SusC/RagA family outer membrane protein [Mucilaginibacter sp. X5P1]